MARDKDKQFYGKTGDIRDWGEVTLDANGTVEVLTYLRTIKSAVANYKSGAIAAVPLVCDCTKTEGAVTIKDPSGVNVGAKVSYLFIGLP